MYRSADELDSLDGSFKKLVHVGPESDSECLPDEGSSESKQGLAGRAEGRGISNGGTSQSRSQHPTLKGPEFDDLVDHVGRQFEEIDHLFSSARCGQGSAKVSINSVPNDSESRYGYVGRTYVPRERNLLPGALEG